MYPMIALPTSQSPSHKCLPLELPVPPPTILLLDVERKQGLGNGEIAWWPIVYLEGETLDS